jgi:sulfoxide reductase catalytic subunit YedY
MRQIFERAWAMQRNQFSIGHASGFIHPVSSDITPQAVYQQRRDLLKRIAAGVAGTSMATWASREALAQAKKPSPLTGQPSKVSGASTMEKVTSYKDATTYNNYYEFGTEKSYPALQAHTLVTKPWSVEIDGLVKKPGRLDIEDLLKYSPMEERIYRMRCVEGLSLIHI